MRLHHQLLVPAVLGAALVARAYIGHRADALDSGAIVFYVSGISWGWAQVSARRRQMSLALMMAEGQVKYLRGAPVQILDRLGLEELRRGGRLPRRLPERRLSRAGMRSRVKAVTMPLLRNRPVYQLEGLSGWWPEECLRPDATSGAA